MVKIENVLQFRIPQGFFPPKAAAGPEHQEQRDVLDKLQMQWEDATALETFGVPSSPALGQFFAPPFWRANDFE